MLCCCDVSCHAMSSYVVVCCINGGVALSCPVTCCVALYRIVYSHDLLCWAVSCCAVLCCVAL